MQLKILGKDRFLRQDPDQQDTTKDAVYAVANPAPKRGDDALRKIGRPKGSEEDDGAPNVLTGTVIVSCFIQTSALPYRIEMQGNDLTFFDDTFEQNGQVIGDTSRLIFTHASGKKGEIISQGFILEKRASVYNTYDNVLSLYSPTPKEGAHNYIFIGRNAYGDDPQRNISSIHFAVNGKSDFEPLPGNPALNGVWQVEYAEDEVFIAPMIYAGRTTSLFPAAPLSGFTSVIVGGQGGFTGMGYLSGANISVMLSIQSTAEITVGANMIPDTDLAYDLGSPSFRFANVYAGNLAVSSFTVAELTVTGDLHVGDDLDVAGDITGPGLIAASTTLRVGTRTWGFGSGDPEGSRTAPVGSLYSRTTGGVGTTLYYKATGSGNTGWQAVA